MTKPINDLTASYVRNMLSYDPETGTFAWLSCVMCAAERCREWQARNKRRYLEAQNESRRVRLYGVDRARYDQMLVAQGGGCAICGDKNRDGRMLAVDHNHACCPGERTCGKCVRGLLCDSCNHAIGKFRDDAALLMRAAEYVRR